MTAGQDGRVRRPYRSVRRQEQAAQTRALVVAAATALFSERGWSATGVRDVARAAGVAVETVYASLGSKTDLLLTAIDVGVVGDTEPVPLSERPEFAALGVGDRADRVRAAAQLLTAIHRRSWGLRRALAEAAASEPELEAKLHELEQRRRDNIREGAEMLIGGPVDDDLLDTLWVLMGADAYALLTQVGGRDDYETWLAAMLERLFPEDRP